jgi:hypothetical protein
VPSVVPLLSLHFRPDIVHRASRRETVGYSLEPRSNIDGLIGRYDAGFGRASVWFGSFLFMQVPTLLNTAAES